MDIVVEAIVVGVLLPAVMMVIGVVLGLVASRDEPDSRDPSIYLAVALAAVAAFTAAFEAFAKYTLWVPKLDYTHWLVYAAIAVSLLGAARAMRWLPAWLYWLLQAAAVFWSSWWLLIPTGWEEADAWSSHASLLLAAAAFANIVLLESASKQSGGPFLPLSLMLNYIAAAFAIERSEWLSMAQLAGVMAVILGVLAVAAWLYPQRFIFRGALPMAGLLLPAMLIQAWFITFASIPGWPLVLIGLGPLVTAILALQVASTKCPRRRAAAFVLSLLLPAAGVIWLIAASALSHSNP